MKIPIVAIHPPLSLPVLSANQYTHTQKKRKQTNIASFVYISFFLLCILFTLYILLYPLHTSLIHPYYKHLQINMISAYLFFLKKY